MPSKYFLGVICNLKSSNDMWRRLLSSFQRYDSVTSTLYDVGALNPDIINNTEMLIIEAFSMDEPVGYEAALSLIETNKILLIINDHTHVSKLSEGSFWITYSFRGDLAAKIQTIIESQFHTKAEFHELANIFPALNNKPKRRHS